MIESIYSRAIIITAVTMIVALIISTGLGYSTVLMKSHTDDMAYQISRAIQTAISADGGTIDAEIFIGGNGDSTGIDILINGSHIIVRGDGASYFQFFDGDVTLIAYGNSVECITLEPCSVIQIHRFLSESGGSEKICIEILMQLTAHY